MTYEIHLHPTYQAPCLWFSLHDLPLDEPAFNIDTVFRRLVPDQFKDGLRSAVGSIGGISADVSAFFFNVPSCNLYVPLWSQKPGIRAFDYKFFFLRNCVPVCSMN